jgi:hypothetical protein
MGAYANPPSSEIGKSQEAVFNLFGCGWKKEQVKVEQGPRGKRAVFEFLPESKRRLPHPVAWRSLSQTQGKRLGALIPSQSSAALGIVPSQKDLGISTSA